MFVSAYSTFTNVTNTRSTHKESKKEFSPSLNVSKNKNNFSLLADKNNILPVNYISDYKVFSNKQRLFEQTQEKELQKYKAIKTKKTARTAYEDGFSIAKSYNRPVLESVKNFSLASNKNTAAKMLNTYAENDRYYQLSVA